MKLLALSCCATKRSDPRLLPALERYDGPMWRTLRARLNELPAAARALANGDLRLTVLSAKWGFIPHTLEMPDYDQRMTEQRAADLCRNPFSEHREFGDRCAEAEAILFAGGDVYRWAMRKASRGEGGERVSETNGRGIGYQRAQLSEWLDRQFPAQLALAL